MTNPEKPKLNVGSKYVHHMLLNNKPFPEEYDLVFSEEAIKIMEEWNSKQK